MKTVRTILMAAIIGFGVFTLATVPAQATEKAKIQKCDKEGKTCVAGKDCSAANCKKPGSSLK